MHTLYPWRDGKGETLSPQEFFELLAPPSRIDGVILHYCRFQRQATLPSLSLSSVREVRLECTPRILELDIHILLKVITKLRSISSIDVSYCGRQPEGRLSLDLTTRSPHDLRKVKDVKILGSRFNLWRILSHLDRVIDFASVENLSLTWSPVMPEIVSHIQRMSNLKSILFTTSSTIRSTLEPFQNLHLECISIVGDFFIRGSKLEYQENNWDLFIRDLGVLAPTNAQRLEIFMRIDNGSNDIPLEFDTVKKVILSQDWEQLAATLQGFQSLHAVHLGIVSTPGWSEPQLKDIWKHLPAPVAPMLHLTSTNDQILFALAE